MQMNAIRSIGRQFQLAAGVWFCVNSFSLLLVYDFVDQEAVSSSGYICQFKDLQVHSVLLDEIMPQPEQPELDCIIITEAKVRKQVLL